MLLGGGTSFKLVLKSDPFSLHFEVLKINSNTTYSSDHSLCRKVNWNWEMHKRAVRRISRTGILLYSRKLKGMIYLTLQNKSRNVICLQS